MDQKYNLSISSDSNDDDIQGHILKCLCILGDRQRKKSKSRKYDPMIDVSKGVVFWETVVQFSQSVICNRYDRSIEYFTQLLFDTSELRDSNSKLVNFSSWFPLHCAAFYSTLSVEHVESLCQSFWRNEEYGAPVTMETPLHIAISASSPNLKIIQCFIKYYPQMVRAETSNGSIPLHYAANKMDNITIIEKLINAYPEGLMKSGTYGKIPLFGACNNYNQNMVQIIKLMLYAAPNSIKHQDKFGNTVLHSILLHLDEKSCSKLFHKLFHLFLEFNSEITMITNREGQTPLHIACESNYNVIRRGIKTLLEYYPLAASILTINEQLPLHIILQSASLATDINIYVPLLLDAYPEAATVADYSGSLPIHYAVMSRLDIKHIERLVDIYPAALQAVARVIRTDKHAHSRTPIMLSVYSFNTRKHKIEYLSEDRLPLLKYLYGKCPEAVHIKSDRGNTLLSDALLCCYFTNKDQIIEAIYHMNPSAILEVNNDGNTPLHAAIVDDNDRLVSPNANYFRFMLKMCPEAASVKNHRDELPHELCDGYHDKYRDEIHRIILLAAPQIEPETLRELNYKARRMAIFVFYSTAVADTYGNIVTKLSLYPDIVRKIVMYF